jgi:HSP20 family molecular chaperone IbpA
MTSKNDKCTSFCGDPEYSVYVRGTIANVTYGDLEEWLKNIVVLKFTHILKVMKNNYGHVHFATKEDAGVFYHTMKGKAFKGPEGCDISFKPATCYLSGNPVNYKLSHQNVEIQPPHEDVEDHPLHEDVEIRPRQNVENQPPRQVFEQNVENQAPSLQKIEQRSQNIGNVEIALHQRKRRAEISLVDHQPMSSKVVPYRIYEDSTTYIVVVNTPYADEDKLVLICEEYMVTLAWKFVDKIPSTFTLVEDYFPAAYATDIKLQERIDKKSAIVNIEGGVTKIYLKKL